MKNRYIQFYKKSTQVKNFHLLVEDEGNIKKLDGRFSLSTCCNIAVKECRNNNYKGFRIMIKKRLKDSSGEYYNTTHILTDLWKVTDNTVEF